MCVELGREGGGKKSRLCVNMLHALVFCVQPGASPRRPALASPPSSQCSELAVLGQGREADAESLVTIVAILSILLQLSNLQVMEVVC